MLGGLDEVRPCASVAGLTPLLVLCLLPSSHSADYECCKQVHHRLCYDLLGTLSLSSLTSLTKAMRKFQGS